MRRKWLLGFVVLFSLFAGSAVVYCLNYSTEKSIEISNSSSGRNFNKTEIVKQSVERKVNKEVNSSVENQRKVKCSKCLVNWIMVNSSRISRRQAQKICSLSFEISNYPLLTLSIIAVESNFNITAVSKAGAIGLMQILPSKQQIDLLKKEGIIKEQRDLFDIDTNIKAGNYIFNQKLKIAKGNISLALFYYVGKNRRYVDKVLTKLGELMLVVESCKGE